MHGREYLLISFREGRLSTLPIYLIWGIASDSRQIAVSFFILLYQYYNSINHFQRSVSVAQSVSASDCYSAHREVDSSILSGDDIFFFLVYLLVLLKIIWWIWSLLNLAFSE